MKISINQPLSLHETGQRANNEDSMFPANGTATVKDNLFVVCDGMGGHHGGDVASQTVCAAFAEFLQPMPVAQLDEKMFERALAFAYRKLDEKDTGEQRGKMGTTLTLLCVHGGGAFMAHIGDSRIYHLRPNREGGCEIVYRSPDHSLVNELLTAGVITEEEAKEHPKRNVITRAMQPHQEKPAKAHIREEPDVQAGDYFFMCSDGILESIDDAMLCEIVGANASDEEKMRTIKEQCEELSKDNFSAYLIPIKSVEGVAIDDRTSASLSDRDVDKTVTDTSASLSDLNTDKTVIMSKTAVPQKPQQTMKPQPQRKGKSQVPKRKKKSSRILILLAVVFLAGAAAMFFWTRVGGSGNGENPNLPPTEYNDNGNNDNNEAT